MALTLPGPDISMRVTSHSTYVFLSNAQSSSNLNVFFLKGGNIEEDLVSVQFFLGSVQKLFVQFDLYIYIYIQYICQFMDISAI